MAHHGALLRGSGITLDTIFHETNVITRKTKIICTLGPACWSVEKLGCLIDAGMNVARLNFSHGDHEGHAATLLRLRQALSTRRGKHVGVMLDTKGPEIRTGFLEGGGPIFLERGQDLEIVTDYSFKGNKNCIACSYASLPASVQVGGSILVADGSLVLKVKEIKNASVVAEVLNNCKLGERKNMNLPGAVVDLPTLTEKDVDDIVNFGMVHGVDFIAASFVRKGSDIDYIREVLGSDPAGANIKIIAKIENQEGIRNYDEILVKTDSIMVARGDMGMEIPPEKVFLAQKYMIRKANVAGKPVVTATQMLESMINNPRPTRAECSDVANAVLDGTDCVMLSGETANGDYPEDAVKIMARICCEAENSQNNDALYQAVRNTVIAENKFMDGPESVASSAVKTAIDTGATLIVALTETGTSARLIAKYRPSMPVIAYTSSEEVARQCNGYLRNVSTRVIGSMIGTDSILFRAIDIAKEKGWVKSGDSVVCVHGQKEATSGSTNSLRVITA
ncbi:pyruvate kinase [Tribonema minus]|uniref:Pyruvate kinase n=1 Tax=Tribonema minus TaxID=303371 RepID=A0A836CKC5_9STRA|nr:pyruvate kinase [Tribonema minus]